MCTALQWDLIWHGKFRYSQAISKIKKNFKENAQISKLKHKAFKIAKIRARFLKDEKGKIKENPKCK